MATRADTGSRPRILAVSHESLLYGAPRSLTMICADLQDRARIRMLTFGPGDMVGFARGQGLDVQVFNACNRVPDNSRPRLAFRIEQAWLRLQRRLCRLAVFVRLLNEVRRADLVYVNTVLKVAPVWAARLMRRPVVLHVREAENYLVPTGRIAQWRLRSLLRSAREVICVSEAVRQLVLAVPGTVLTQARVHTVHNGIDAGAFAPDARRRAEFRDEHGIPADAPVACFVGNMSERKGISVFLRATAALRAEFPDAHFVVAGGTDADIAEMRRAFVSAELESAVHFLGFVSDVRPVLWGSDVFAMLSLCEPFARVNLEASAAGCAAVATAVDGNVEIFRDGENALVIPPADLPAATAAIGRLFRDAALRERLAGAARAQVAERFTLSACHDRVAQILLDKAGA